MIQFIQSLNLWQKLEITILIIGLTHPVFAKSKNHAVFISKLMVIGFIEGVVISCIDFIHLISGIDHIPIFVINGSTYY